MFPRSLRNLARHKKVFVSLSVKVTFPTRWEWWTLKGVSERLNDWKALQAVPIRKNTHHLSSSHVVSVGLHFMILLIKNELLECQHSVSSNTHTHVQSPSSCRLSEASQQGSFAEWSISCSQKPPLWYLSLTWILIYCLSKFSPRPSFV